MSETKQKSVAIIGIVGTPAKYGGFETLANHMVLNLGDELDFTVYCSKYNYSKEERIKTWKGAKLKYLPFSANGAQSIIYDIVSMIHAVFFYDVLLILGVSGCIFLPILKLFTSKKIIVNIDGLEWRRAKWSQPIKSFLKYSEKMAVKYADEVVTDNKAIYNYVVEEYNVISNLIQYGSDHVSPVNIEQKDLNRYPFLAGNYAFKVARIEPENNVYMVLDAFSKTDTLPLVMVGNWFNSEYGIALYEEFYQSDNLTLLDAIYDSNELNLIRSNCSLYIHGYSAGGTNPSLVEAMYLELPVLCYGVIYNRITTNNQAFYFNNKSSLIETLNSLNKDALVLNKQNMKAYADKKYKWNRICKLYQEILTGITSPIPCETVYIPEVFSQPQVSRT